MEIPNDRTDTYLNAVRQQIGSHLQLVVTIFPTSCDDRYAALKKLCCIDSPIPSQVLWVSINSHNYSLYWWKIFPELGTVWWIYSKCMHMHSHTVCIPTKIIIDFSKFCLPSLNLCQYSMMSFSIKVYSFTPRTH